MMYDDSMNTLYQNVILIDSGTPQYIGDYITGTELC